MLVLRKGDDELIRVLSADIEDLEARKKKVGQAISDFNEAYFNIGSQLALKKQKLRRLRNMLDDKLTRMLSADIEDLEARKKNVGQAISDFNNVFSNIESQLALKKQQKCRLKKILSE